MPESTHDDSTDIVVKDQNGRFQVQMPALPVVEDEQAQGDAEAAESDSGKESQSPLTTYSLGFMGWDLFWGTNAA